MVGGGTSEIVDLVTTSRDLEDEIIKEFPGKITEEQHYRDKSDPHVTLYWFYQLPKKILLDFLNKYKNKYRYEIKHCTKSTVVEINVPEFHKHTLS